ncbi:MAG: bifunctional demethylmenaquinone methyltransferase/2-methoxy-6-polyprenyl-1,4-benzoquinol methylase UbiE [candidate division Zixibacteria bacterium]|nr:bifunctional demethylmenaquinone methyltransferase/2-methoxy-6-polyprenyl-1,4-benzoquinol methylase UbiE [candidate division Zixibacteria bacterium]
MKPLEHAIPESTDYSVNRREDTPSRVDSHIMFDRISARYDFLNHLLSFGQDFLWRRKVALLMKRYAHETVLDLACGTCDLILTAFKYNRDIRLGLGIDMADRMLALGSHKVDRSGLSNKISLTRGDGMSLPVRDNSVDFSMISFGIRNMVDPPRALSELCRVLKPRGRLAVLEFSLPQNRFLRAIYLVYFRKILPRLGGLISGDYQAYNYLDKTVETFSYGEKFCRMMLEAGFGDVQMRPMTFGTVILYVGVKG